MIKSKMTATALSAFLALGLLAAPLGAAAQAETKTLEVTITNLTAKQALSPPIVVTHPATAHAWQMGQVASAGLELVAEEGMNDTLASELRAVATDIQMGTEPLMPGKSVTLKIKARQGDVLSAATMLVQTNDGFTGLDNMTLDAMGDKDAMAYDAGTEENTELAAHVPGPPFNGHNAGTATNPKQPIAMHTGIKGTADVTTDFNWSGAVARFSVHAAMGDEGAMTGGESTTTGGEQTMSGTGSTTEEMPNMPKTGAGEDATLLLITLAAGALLLVGGLARRFQPKPR
jgi:hypothetical protein